MFWGGIREGLEFREVNEVREVREVRGHSKSGITSNQK